MDFNLYQCQCAWIFTYVSVTVHGFLLISVSMCMDFYLYECDCEWIFTYVSVTVQGFVLI